MMSYHQTGVKSLRWEWGAGNGGPLGTNRKRLATEIVLMISDAIKMSTRCHPKKKGGFAPDLNSWSWVRMPPGSLI